MGATSFSPTYSANFLDIKALTLLKKKKDGKRVRWKHLTRACRSSSWEESPQTLLEYPLHTLLDSAHAKRRRIKDSTNHGSVGRKLREEWLLWREESQGSHRDRRAAKKAGGMRLREERTRLESARIKAARSSFQPYGVTKIEVLDDEGHWVEKTTQQGVVQGFVREALSRGSQTRNTPFMRPPLRGDFGFSATSPAIEQVLAGSYIPPLGTDPYVVKLLPHLKMPQVVSDAEKLNSTIPKDSFARSWSRMKEFTGTGPSGLHFGHFKVMHRSPLSTDIYMPVYPKSRINLDLARSVGDDVWITCSKNLLIIFMQTGFDLFIFLKQMQITT